MSWVCVSAQETVPDTLSSHRPDSLQPLPLVSEVPGSGGVEPKVLTHLSFKGIPIDGSMEAFSKGLVDAGYRQAGGGVYVGFFAGVENAAVVPVAFSGKVWKASVFLPALATWSGVKEQYRKFKDQFAWKYVVAPSVVKESLSMKYREGSGQEMWGFESGMSVYKTVFEFPDGQIVLYIAYDKASGGMRVCIDYIDRVNELLKEENDMKDL